MRLTANEAKNRLQGNWMLRRAKGEPLHLLDRVRSKRQDRLFIFGRGGTAIVAPADDQLPAQVAEFDFESGVINPAAQLLMGDYATQVKAVQDGGIDEAWVSRGGKFVVWLAGHVHCNMLFYPTKFPNLLVCATTMAGNLTGSNREDRTLASASANFVAIDTEHGVIKLVKLGHNSDRYLTPTNYICYDYINRKIVNEG